MNVPLNKLAGDVLPSAMQMKTAGILREDHALQGLTAQQEMFAKLLFNGTPQTDAYRQAYRCENAKPETVMQMAIRAAQMPMVVARVRQLQERWEGRASLDLLIRRDEVQRGIAAIAFDPTAKNSDKLKAFDMLSKQLGLYRVGEAPKDDSDLSLAEVEERLLAKVQALKVAGGSSTASK